MSLWEDEHRLAYIAGARLLAAAGIWFPYGEGPQAPWATALAHRWHKGLPRGTGPARAPRRSRLPTADSPRTGGVETAGSSPPRRRGDGAEEQMRMRKASYVPMTVIIAFHTCNVVFSDILLLYKCDPRVTTSVLVITCMFATAKTAENALGVSLLIIRLNVLLIDF
eukprot:gene38436-22362_t